MNRRRINLFAFVALLAMVFVVPASADPDPNDGTTDGEDSLLDGGDRDPAASLVRHDSATASMVVSGGPVTSGKGSKNLVERLRGERLLPGATTDVWELKKRAYIGTFSDPCGDGTGANGSGIRIFDIRDVGVAEEVGVVPSVLGSRSNDVKVASMGGRRILVHSNEECAGGPGGFEIWNVKKDNAPVHLASVRIDELNEISDFLFGGITDVGVHNLFLFGQGERQYVAAVAETAFDNFMIFDITDPTNPSLTSSWGAEEIFDPGVGDLSLADPDGFDRGLNAALWLLDGFGDSQNRFLHDITISADGTSAYLSNWDAGLVLLDISDPTDPTLVSVALDPVNGSRDGEVNSHAAWPNEDGSIVVEGEEDFSPFSLTFSITAGPNADGFPAAEGAFTTPIFTLPGFEMSGPTTYVGLACTGGDPVPAGSGIAVIQRGVCRFDEKASNAIAAGYDGMVVFNDAARGDALVTMGGDPRDIPGVFVGHSTGLAIIGVGNAAALMIGDTGAPISAVAVPGSWGGVRIWDYSDPTDPVLLSTFDTVCSADAGDPSCDPRGTYTTHNVIVRGDRAYFSWYADGVLVLDISDPANPVETARFHETGAAFEASNGGIQDVWGIGLSNNPNILASDRNGGLYVLRLGKE